MQLESHPDRGPHRMINGTNTAEGSVQSGGWVPIACAANLNNRCGFLFLRPRLVERLHQGRGDRCKDAAEDSIVYAPQ
jgi:hypothetical protein